MLKKILSILLFLSLTAAFCSVSLADDMMPIGKGGFLIYVSYQDTLPDGRMIFCGSGGEDYDGQRAKLLCVNPDGTISWEYVDQNEQGYYEAVILEDGNIAVSMQKKVVLFTPEGKNTGKEIIQDRQDGSNPQVLSRGVLKHYGEEDGYTEFVDWDGNTLFRTDGAFYATLVDDDGLVMAGQESDDGSTIDDAMIMKIDWQGKRLWKKILPSMTEERGEATDISYLEGCLRTSDGGYLAVHKQSIKDYDYPARNEYHEWRDYTELVKLSTDGEILWTKQPGKGQQFEYVVEYEGKYCVSYHSGLDLPGNIGFLWLDAEGNELGTTIRSINREDIPGQRYGRGMRKMQLEMIPSKDVLWQNLQLWNEDWTSKEGNTIWNTQQLLLPVPVL